MDNGGRDAGVRERFFDDDGRIPNNPMLPLLIYPRALEESARPASGCKELLSSNGWRGAWVDCVFPYHHYHSNAHEVLCVVEGSATLTFGGSEGETVEVEAGDVIVIPAGTGHCKERASSDFSVVGAYPRGQENYDLRTGEGGERPEALENIRNVPLPEADPLFGDDGPLPDHWSG